MEKEIDILVIGAGLTGLTTAHYLHKANRNFIVLERKNEVGGDIQTAQEGDFVFEKGPSTGVMSNDTVAELFDDIKAYCTLEGASKEVNKRYILKNGSWKALPAGLIGGITTPLFRFSDKLRILGEPFRKPGTDPNETLDQFVIRRLGKSMLDYAVDPFILGVYAGDPSYLVPRFALPKLYNLEQKYGSFIGGTIKLHREKARTGQLKKKQPHRIFSVEGGLSNFMHGIYQSAGTENFVLGVKELSISYENGIYHAQGKKEDGSTISVKAKKVINTGGAYELPALFPFIEKEKVDKIDNLLYARVIQVALGFKHWDGFHIDAFGGLIPFKEKRDILGVLFPSAFLKDRAPKGGAMLSVFVGGVRRPEMVEKSDDEIREIVKREVKDIMQMKTFEPDIFNIYRYKHAIPQYGADCEARFATIEQIEKQYPGLILGGNLRNGIGMADRIQQAKTLAESI
jgi:oxygen-dependent protoporphyrinogen oxidase